jgi:hypothetical protein
MLDYIGPHMFPTDGAIDVPDLLKPSHGSEIIDVPVWSYRRFLVMGHACPDATRPTRTANVDVESRMDAALSKPTDLEKTGGGRGE